MSDEKKVILMIGNVRIKEYDSMNVVVEKYEKVFVPTKKLTEQRWKFKGYSRSVLSALLLIQRNELLVDKKAVTDLESYLKQVKESNDKLLDVMKQ